MLKPEQYYLKIGRASDLSKAGERRLYRFLEIFPGALSWLTLLLVIFLSWQKPVWVAFFIIIFDLYWVLKTIFLSFHQQSAFKKMKRNLKIDWMEKLRQLEGKNWQDIYHLVILPVYKEKMEIVHSTFQALVSSRYPLDKLIVVLAIEERAGAVGEEIAKKIQEEFGDKFFRFLITVHPQDIEGEIAGKGSNETWAGRKAKELIDDLKIPYERIIVSSFDINTQVYPQYFACATYNYLTCPDPLHSSFQPIPIYNNNI